MRSSRRGTGVSPRALEGLLAQDREAVLRREAGLFDELAGPGAPIVLFGAGRLGRRTVAALRDTGVRPVALADNDPGLHGRTVEGLEVFSPAEAAARFGRSAAFVVTVFLGSDAVRRQLRTLGCRTVLPFYPLFWKYPEGLLPHYSYDLPHRVIDARRDIVEAWNLLADDASRAEFFGQVAWRLDPGRECPPASPGDEIYFPPDLVALGPEEVFVDCGAFDGDTLRRFLDRTGGAFGEAVAFEPDPHNFRRLEEAVGTLPRGAAGRIALHRAALGARRGTVRIDLHGLASAVSDTGTESVPMVTLDDILAGKPSTFIKMDIEGAELEALQGAAAHVRAHHPLLAVSAYHRHDHLWKIPLLIRSLSPEYRFHLRRHNPEIVDDLVVYAVPGRRAAPGRKPH